MRGRPPKFFDGNAQAFSGLRFHLAGQSVEGAIIALEDDQKLRWALAAVQGVQFYRYQMSFSLVKG